MHDRVHVVQYLLAVLSHQLLEVPSLVDDQVGHHVTHAATGAPNDQFRAQHRCLRHGLAIELVEHQAGCLLPLLLERLPNRGKRDRREPPVLDIVEADQRDVLRNAYPARVQGFHGAQSHEVVGGHDSVEMDPALIEQRAHRVDSRGHVEVAERHELRLEGKAVLSEHGAIDVVAFLRLVVHTRTADEGDPAQAVIGNQMRNHFARAARVVDQHGGCARNSGAHGAHGQGPVAFAVLAETLGSRGIRERRGHDQTINVLLPGQIVDEVAALTEAVR